MSVYGQRWADSYDDVPSEPWAIALDAATDAEFKRALKSLMSSGDAHPPSLPQFVELLKPGQAKKAAAGAELFTPEWNEGRNALLEKIAKQSRERGVVFTPEQRAESHAALTLATLTPGEIGHAEAKVAYEAGAAARLARMVTLTPAEQLARYGGRQSARPERSE